MIFFKALPGKYKKIGYTSFRNLEKWTWHYNCLMFNRKRKTYDLTRNGYHFSEHYCKCFKIIPLTASQFV